MRGNAALFPSLFPSYVSSLLLFFHGVIEGLLYILDSGNKVRKQPRHGPRPLGAYSAVGKTENEQLHK